MTVKYKYSTKEERTITLYVKPEEFEAICYAMNFNLPVKYYKEIVSITDEIVRVRQELKEKELRELEK